MKFSLLTQKEWMIAIQKIMIGVRTVLLGSAGGTFFPSTLYTSVDLLQFSYMTALTQFGLLSIVGLVHHCFLLTAVQKVFLGSVGDIFITSTIYVY